MSHVSVQPPAGPQQEGVVVVGAGMAGWSAVKAIRTLDSDIPITMISGCSANIYHKPELSIAISRGLKKKDLIRETAADAASRLGIRLYSDTFVVGLSTVSHQIRTTRGTIKYTHLILAQGARPALPSVLPEHLCWRINDLAGWSGLREKLSEKSQKIAIVGAGMIGCELAEDFAQAGHNVTLIDIQPHPLSSLLPDVACLRLQEKQKQLGIQYLGNTLVSALTETTDGQKLITTEEGQKIEVDHVIAATGLVTDRRLADHAGIVFENGIKVDKSTLQTSAPQVYALGDCVSFEGVPCRFIEPILRQANAIAHDILGMETESYEHRTPPIRLKIKSLPIELNGLPTEEGEWKVIEDNQDFLHMEQVVGDVTQSTLRVGAVRKAA
ncbi:FAD-dependent oxidoreductase [Methylophaga thalassica]|uniref:FAD-dependent oxidoreductase n=1 Tax=Methylophaga aminisulfidivorans TaxID=230105 RepID=UPI0024E1B74A|nr:FAD-dependent oxidoreductase [Methylophaga aminisulfidivorans]